VQKAHEIDAQVISIPSGRFVNALVISGLPTDFAFLGGFLPSKKGERLARLKESKRNSRDARVFTNTAPGWRDP